MGTLIANRFSIIWRWFQLLGVFRSFGIGFCFWGYQRNFITSCIESLLRRLNIQCIQKSKRRTYEVVRGKISFDHRTFFFLVVRNLRVLHGQLTLQQIYYYFTIIREIQLIFHIQTVQSIDYRNPKYEQKILQK